MLLITALCNLLGIGRIECISNICPKQLAPNFVIVIFKESTYIPNEILICPERMIVCAIIAILFTYYKFIFTYNVFFLSDFRPLK